MLHKIIIVCLVLTFMGSACIPEISTQSIIITPTTGTPTSTFKLTATQLPHPTLIHTSIPTKTPQLLTRTVEPTLSNTATPFTLLEAPAGIIYRTKNGLYITEGLDKAKLLFALNDPEFSYFSPEVSPDGLYVLLSTFAKQSIINFKTGDEVFIWPKAGYNLCPFSWINRKPLFLFTVLLPEGSDPGYSCSHGSPVLLSIDDKIIVFDKKGLGWSSPDVSSDGKVIAYDLGGKPIIFDWQSGSQPFNSASYGFPYSDKVAFTDPSWSPSRSKLAWTY
jgi:hypothetical protein